MRASASEVRSRKNAGNKGSTCDPGCLDECCHTATAFLESSAAVARWDAIVRCAPTQTVFHNMIQGPGSSPPWC